MQYLLKKGNLKSVKDDTLVVPVWQEGKKGIRLSADLQLFKKTLGNLEKENVFTAKPKEVVFLRYTDLGPKGVRNLLFVGLGNQKETDIYKIRKSLVTAGLELKKHKVKSFTLYLNGLKGALGSSDGDVARLAAEFISSPLYICDQFRSKKEDGLLPKKMTLLIDGEVDSADVRQGLKRAEVVMEAINYIRNLILSPANVVTPTELAHQAELIGKNPNVTIKILNEKEIEKEKMGALLSVSRGSDHPPRFIVLDYRPAGGKNLKTVALVGKGITFDSGGINLKPSQGIEEMKCDMSGAATVLGIVKIASQLNLPIHLVGLIAASENLPSGKATTPGSIVTSRSGQTVEVINTDAEGRLVLCDALDYAKQYHPEAIIDLATLTGACVIALGHEGAGILGNNQALIDQLLHCSQAVGERIWQLPLWEEYEDDIKSDLADIRNVGYDRGAGTSKGAFFLKKFVDDKCPWAHLDIAGPAILSRKPHPLYGTGGTSGVTVQLLVEYLTNLSY